MDEIDKCYDILDLRPGASPAEVKHAYRELVKVWHPDRFSHDPQLLKRAGDKLREINEAYSRLQSFQTELEDSHISWEEYKQKTSPKTADNRQSRSAAPPKTPPPTDRPISPKRRICFPLWPVRAIITILLGIVLTWLVNYIITAKLPLGNTSHTIQSALKDLKKKLSPSLDHRYKHLEGYFDTKKFGTLLHEEPLVSHFSYKKNFTTRTPPTMIVPGDQENRR